jgi:hypothetical protein
MPHARSKPCAPVAEASSLRHASLRTWRRLQIDPRSFPHEADSGLRQPAAGLRRPRVRTKRCHQPGLRRWRQQRRTADARLRRAVQRRLATREPGRLVGAVRLCCGQHLVGDAAVERGPATGPVLPGTAGSRRRHRQCPASTRCGRQRGHEREFRQGRSGQQQHGAVGRVAVRRRAGRPGGLRRGWLLRGQLGRPGARQYRRRAARRSRLHRHATERQRLQRRRPGSAQQRCGCSALRRRRQCTDRGRLPGAEHGRRHHAHGRGDRARCRWHRQWRRYRRHPAGGHACRRLQRSHRSGRFGGPAAGSGRQHAPRQLPGAAELAQRPARCW